MFPLYNFSNWVNSDKENRFILDTESFTYFESWHIVNGWNCYKRELIPNEETIKAIEESDKGKLIHYNTIEDLFADLKS